MSFGDICARTDPSTHSTIEWMIDWGWMTTPRRSGGTSKSQRASMTSSPLFIIVAESIVIFGPIFQVGWARASSIVIASNVSRGRVRNGPPDAVRTSRSTSEWTPAAERLVEGAVLRVDGEDRRAGGGGGRHHRLARDDEDFLVREGERLAELHRLVRRRKPGRADDAAEDDVDLGEGGDVDDPLLAAADAHAGELPADAVRVGALLHRDDRRAEAGDGGEERFEVRAGRHRDDAEAVGEGLEDRERRPADGAGGAEEGDVARGVHRGRSSGRRVRIP